MAKTNDGATGAGLRTDGKVSKSGNLCQWLCLEYHHNLLVERLTELPAI
jgi:hypothetical protein